MFKLLFTMMFSFFVFLSYADEVSLILDTGGSDSEINHLIVTNSGEIITSNDMFPVSVFKSSTKDFNYSVIRVYDATTFEIKRNIYLNNMDMGVISALALSPDEKYLSVAYHFTNKVIIYNYITGQKVIELDYTQKDLVFFEDITFSDDGKYFALLAEESLENKKRIDIYKTKDWTRSKQINTSINSWSKIVMLKDKYDYSIYTTSSETMSKYSLFEDNKNTFIDENIITSMAISKNHIALVLHNDRIVILDRQTLLKVKEIQTKTKNDGIKYSPDGRFLITGSDSPPYIVSIFDVQLGYILASSFDGHDGRVASLGFLNSHTAVTAGGSNYDLIKWDFDSIQAKELLRVSKLGKAIWSLGVKSNIIAYGQTDSNNKRFTDYEILKAHLHGLELKKNIENDNTSFEKSFDILHMLPGLNINSIPKINNASLFLEKGEGDYYDTASSNLVLPNGIRIKPNNKLFSHRCFGWWREFVISGGDGIIKVYNQKGLTVATLGIPPFFISNNKIVSLAVDADRLYSGSTDGTIKIWDLRRVINGESNIETPLVTLFIGNDNEWIIWTNDGFFDASASVAKRLGVFIKNDLNDMAEFVSVDKMYYAFYRPDLIKKALAGESLKKYADKIKIADILKDGLAPKVSILSASNYKNVDTADLRLKVCERGGSYNNLTLTINRKVVDILSGISPVKTYRDAFSTCYEYTKSLKLADGENTIGFRATNSSGSIMSDTAETSLTYKAPSKSKPSLYILSIAVNQYREDELHYSIADSKLLIEAFNKYSKDLYDIKPPITLWDKQATKANILAAFEKIGKETQRDDVFVLHVVGHGKVDTLTGEYYFLPSDFRWNNSSSLSRRGFSRGDFTLAMSKIQAINSLMLIDTCESGALIQTADDYGNKEENRGGSDPLKQVNDLSIATGAAIMAAAASNQAAKAANGHGAHTATFVEGLKGVANNNGQAMLLDVSNYVDDAVPSRTDEAQDPKNNLSGRNFPLAGKRNKSM